MGKRRNDHGSCTNDDYKRSKTIVDSPSPSHRSILLVPDTPQSQIKNKAPVPSTCYSEAKVPLLVTDDFDDEFSDEEACDIDISAVEKIQNTFSSFTSYQRLSVLNVEEHEGTKVVLCQDAIKGDSIKLKCSGEWYFSKIEAGSYIHVISPGINRDEIEIRNDNSNMVIAYPDILVSPTTISSSVRCPRQAVLGEVFKPTVGYSCNEVMLQGTINHALFDVALREQKFDESFLKSKLNDVLESDEIIDSLSCMDLDKECMVEKIIPNIKFLSNWANKFCRGNGTNVSYGQLGDEVMKIDKVLDIEENIWSPKYGCKGKVDATVRIHSKHKYHISPIEVKSGSSRNSLGSIDHRAQVILYTMMLEERYKDTVDKGLLYYIKGQQTIGVPSSGVERRALAIKRNEIAGALHDILNRDKVHLPDLVNDKMACKYCNHQLSCSLAYRSFEDMDPDFHPYPEILENNTSSLSQVHLDYFKKFSLLCLQEAQTSNKSSKMPWDSSCKKYSKLSLTNVTPNHGFYHTFALRFPINPRSTLLRLGDYAIISKEDGSAYNILAGFVTSLSDTTLELYSMDTDLSASPHHRTGPSYFITPTSSLSSLHTSLGNLTSLMSPGCDRTEKWRRCVVEGAPPHFNNTLFSYAQEAGISREFAAGAEGELILSLNEDQKLAVERAVSVEDYLCILGMPGTGKTSTISCLIQLLVARGNTVLLTAYTHSAVDNLVMKLPPTLDVVRLGAPGRIHPANKCRSSQVLTSHIRDPRKLREFYQSKAVVATTCLGLKHSVFEYKKFDFCIIDELTALSKILKDLIDLVEPDLEWQKSITDDAWTTFTWHTKSAAPARPSADIAVEVAMAGPSDDAMPLDSVTVVRDGGPARRASLSDDGVMKDDECALSDHSCAKMSTSSGRSSMGSDRNSISSVRVTLDIVTNRSGQVSPTTKICPVVVRDLKVEEDYMAPVPRNSISEKDDDASVGSAGETTGRIREITEKLGDLCLGIESTHVAHSPPHGATMVVWEENKQRPGRTRLFRKLLATEEEALCNGPPEDINFAAKREKKKSGNTPTVK